MAIPNYDRLMKPLLQALAHGQPLGIQQLIDQMCQVFNLSDDERSKSYDKTNVTLLGNKLAWAKVYLGAAELIEQTDTGVYAITAKGQEVLLENPSKVDKSYLMKFPKFVEFITRGGAAENPDLTVADLTELITAFEKWYAKPENIEREIHYDAFLSKGNLENLPKREFIKFFSQFRIDGGMVQSGGERNSQTFSETLENQYADFKNHALAPFAVDFNVIDWLNDCKTFPQWGKGVATVYLNRVNKAKFCIVNNKSQEALTKLGFEIPKGKTVSQYLRVKAAQDYLLSRYPVLNHYFKVDALNHFAIAVDEGIEIVARLAGNKNATGVRYWIFQCNPDNYDFQKEAKKRKGIAWTVNAHKDKIKPGDKGIIWVTGKFSGCYALFTVKQKPRDDHEGVLRSEIIFDKNLALAPILKSQIEHEKWFEDFKGGYQGTNFELTPKQYAAFESLANAKSESPLEILQGEPVMAKKEIPLNQIFFGPPGTGKTYTSLYKALEIIDGHSFETESDERERRKKALKRFETLRNDGQIEFITFHQSYSYEEFIEGISPEVNEAGQITYERKDGVFKKFVKAMGAQAAADVSEFSNDAEVWRISLVSPLDSKIEDKFYDEGFVGLDYIANVDFKKIDVVEYYETSESKSGRVNLTAFVNDLKIGDAVCTFENRRSIGAIGVVTGEYEYHPGQALPHRRRVKWLQREKHDIFQLNGLNLMMNGAFHRLRLTTQDLIALLGKGSATQKKNFVFIIDEINRGNISKIFGELITLLEADKRSGHGGVAIKLPYTKEQFILPPNLYVIGTMNTADRSIAMIDIALRRRFVFEQIEPNSELVIDRVPGMPGINFKKVFELLNNKICLLQGRDYQIGHSYFLKDSINSAADLKDAWFNKLMPLLNEYFHEEWEKLSAILGPFVTSKSLQGLEDVSTENRVFQFVDHKSVNDQQFANYLQKIEGKKPADTGDKEKASA